MVLYQPNFVRILNKIFVLTPSFLYLIPSLFALISCSAHWSRFMVFVQQLFYSRFLADFSALCGKLGVFGTKYRAAIDKIYFFYKYFLI